MIVVDASAIVAIAFAQAEREAFVQAIQRRVAVSARGEQKPGTVRGTIEPIKMIGPVLGNTNQSPN